MRSKIYYIILLFIWPFLAFLIALFKGFKKSNQIIILVFSFLYGYSVYLYSGDILRYQETFIEVSKYTWEDFWFILIHKWDPQALSLYTANAVTHKPDIFALFLTFITSRFTENPRIFWAILSLIYTWFMLLFLNEVNRHIYRGPKIFWHYVIIIFLVCLVPFYVGVTGVRFWPALFLFMYFLMRYIRLNSTKDLLATGISVLFHYTFFVPVGILFIVYLMPIKRYIIKLIVILSLLFFAISSTTSIFGYLNSLVEATDETTLGLSMESYADQTYFEQKEEVKAQRNWYVSLRSDSLFYILIVAVFMDIFGFIGLKEVIFTKRMFPIVAVFFCLALLTYHLGSIGRFKNVFYLLALTRYSILFPYNYRSRFMRLLTLVLMPTLILYILVTFRAGFYTIDPLLLINNSLLIFFIHANESLSELIVGH